MSTLEYLWTTVSLQYTWNLSSCPDRRNAKVIFNMGKSLSHPQYPILGWDGMFMCILHPVKKPDLSVDGCNTLIHCGMWTIICHPWCYTPWIMWLHMEFDSSLFIIPQVNHSLMNAKIMRMQLYPHVELHKTNLLSHQSMKKEVDATFILENKSLDNQYHGNFY